MNLIRVDDLGIQKIQTIGHCIRADDHWMQF